MKGIHLLPLLLVLFLAQEVSSSPMTTDASSSTGFDCGTVPQPCSSVELDKCKVECAALYESGTCDRTSCENCCYARGDGCADYSTYLCCYYEFCYEEIPDASCYLRGICSSQSALMRYDLTSFCSSSRFTFSFHILSTLSFAL